MCKMLQFDDAERSIRVHFLHVRALVAVRPVVVHDDGQLARRRTHLQKRFHSEHGQRRHERRITLRTKNCKNSEQK
jgi:hypothetical protein